MNTEEKLARIKGYSTRYELVLSHPDGRKFLVGYTPRKGRDGLFAMVAKNGPKIVALTGSEDITFDKKVNRGATMGEWAVCFSGRTQRESILGGELAFVGSL